MNGPRSIFSDYHDEQEWLLDREESIGDPDEEDIRDDYDPEEEDPGTELDS